MAKIGGQLGGVGVEEMEGAGAGVGAALGGEAAGLVDQFLGEVEGGEVAVTEGPEAQRHAAGPAAGFEERGGVVGEEAADEFAFRRPEAEFVCRARVMDDRDQVVEIGADGGGGNLGRRGEGSERENFHEAKGQEGDQTLGAQV